MCLHGSAGHLQLAGDLVVIAPLEQQFHDLSLPLPELDGYFVHTPPY